MATDEGMQQSAAETLDALATTKLDDLESAEALRLTCCPMCRATVGEDEEDRAAVCREYRCGLRDLDSLQREASFVVWASRALEIPGDTKALDTLNHHIFAAGAVTPGLALTEADGHSFYLIMPTLRAQLHGALLGHLFRTSGMGIFNAARDTAKDVARMAAEWRAEYEQYRRRRDEDAVCALFDQGRAISAIAKEMKWGKNRDKVNDILYARGKKERPM